jgi:hypothetical protein
MSYTRCVAIALLIVAMTCGACARAVRTEAVRFDAATRASAVLTLQATTAIPLDTGYAQDLAKGSVRRRTGRVPQGDVYAPQGTVFSVRGRQKHEAWLVVRDESLQGLYLPGESRYLPLSFAIPISLREGV